ncbi:TIGR00341 family protein [Crocosphaera sp.]|uniref:TIGR00341 family protein n=1 Tax=Crocosphaera sp. TaxID=2729996 RepID=UPI00261305AF|nr:TIGR00341 family protein [Crocosphaera sp.]MDJ0580198.1 TIGR00341 family protein [Crocosphaera sp.]
MFWLKLQSFIKQEWRLFRDTRIGVQVEKIPKDKLSQILINQVLARNFCIFLILATTIATFGLISNSAATIIGAMIIAPLMIPIIGIAYALVTFNTRLISYSLIRLILGIFVTVGIAFLTTEIIGYRLSGSEILARTEPTLLDLGVAIAAGTAGGFAKVRRSVSDAIPGVAISVALVPPLCVVGIGFAVSDFSLSIGSFMLFLTNLVGIILTAAIVFLLDSYGSWKKAAASLFGLLASLILITLPLNFSFREMIIENQIRHELAKRHSKNRDREESLITQVNVQLQEGKIIVTADVIITPDKLDNIDPEENLQQTQKILSDKMGQPVELRVRVFPIDILNFEAD